MKKLLIIILFLQGCAWSNFDRALFATYAVSNTIDIFQTREILSNDDYVERNPIMKNMTPNQSTAFMVGAMGLTYLLANYIPKYRTLIITVPLAISMACIMNNFSVGIRF